MSLSGASLGGVLRTPATDTHTPVLRLKGVRRQGVPWETQAERSYPQRSMQQEFQIGLDHSRNCRQRQRSKQVDDRLCIDQGILGTFDTVVIIH